MHADEKKRSRHTKNSVHADDNKNTRVDKKVYAYEKTKHACKLKKKKITQTKKKNAPTYEKKRIC